MSSKQLRPVEVMDAPIEVAIDPTDLFFPMDVKKKLIEKRWPHVPRMAELPEIFAQLTPTEREAVTLRAVSMIELAIGALEATNKEKGKELAEKALKEASQLYKW